MNLDQIATPSDLLKINNTPTNLETALEAVGELNYEEAKKVALHIIQALGYHHQNVIQEEVDANNASNVTAWAQDEHRLNLAHNLLNEVEL